MVTSNEYTRETTDALPSQLLIKIESFSLLWKHKIQQYESREFEAGDYKWKLIIYLNEDDISADLAIAGTDSLAVGWEVNAIFSIFFFDQNSDNYVCFRGTKVCRFHAMKSKWGLSKFISKKSLTKEFLVDDNCVFGAEVFVCKRQPVNECVSVLKVKDPYKRDFKIPHFSKLKDVWSSEEFTAEGHKWKINLYPNGRGIERDQNVSTYLVCVDSNGFAPHEKLKAHFCLRIKNQLNEDDRTRNFSCWFTPSSHSWGSQAIIPIGDMRDKNKGFIVDDRCLLQVEISTQVVVRDAC